MDGTRSSIKNTFNFYASTLKYGRRNLKEINKDLYTNQETGKNESGKNLYSTTWNEVHEEHIGYPNSNRQVSFILSFIFSC